MTEKQLAQLCAKALSSKRASGILILDVADQTVLCNYFVIASGRSSTQVNALGEAVEEAVKKACDRAPIRCEGLREGRWGVLDYGDVIVHIFNDESRTFYNLERLWTSGTNAERYVDEEETK